MTIVSLERRLRKLEAARGRDGYAMFAAWGRTPEEASRALEQARAIGTVHPGDEAAAFVWPHPDPVPRSRWTSFGRRGEADLSDRELVAMVDAMQAEETRREREDAIAAGEDVSGLDETDFLIRAIRCEGRNAVESLRQLAHRQNPEPKVHWPETDQRGAAVAYCACATCQTGETSPRDAFRLRDARRKAWLNRYAPGEELFA